MMFKKLLRLTIPAMAVAGVSQSAFAAVTTQPYFDVQEIKAASDAFPSDSDLFVHRFRGVAMGPNGNYVVARTQAFRDPFSDYDINLPFTFAHGCQYADEICTAAWRGYQKRGNDIKDGFYYYRKSFTSAFKDSTSYTSHLVALISGDTSSLTLPPATVYPNVVELPSDTLSKFRINGDTSDDTHDTRITDITPQEIRINGVDAYWVTGYDIDPLNRTPSKGFVEALNAEHTHIVLEPANTSSDLHGGLSAGYRFGHNGSNWFVTGMTAVARPEDNDNDGDFQRCYNREQDIDDDDDFSGHSDYLYCPGLKTQTAVWNLGSVNSGAVSPTNLSASWNGDSDVNHSAAGLGANNSGMIVGYETHGDRGGDLGAYGRASIYQFITGTPDSLHRYLLSGEGLVGNDDDDDIRDQWAVDITDSTSSPTYVIGNERYTSSEASDSSNHNQTVNFFISQLDDSTVEDPNHPGLWHGTVKWPLRNVVRGASNQIAAIDHSTGYAVGWRETDNTVTAYNGIRRTQTAFLFDTKGYMDSGASSPNNYLWSLQSLTCYTEDNSSVHMPLYRIEHASAVQGDGTNLTVLASGYKYNSVEDYIDRWNATPVVLKLTHSSDASINSDINSLSGCPVYEPDTKHSRSGAGAGWLALLLLPGLFVRVITKRKQTLSAS